MAEANLAANMADAAAITANSPTGLSVSVAPGVVGMHGFTGFASPPARGRRAGPPRPSARPGHQSRVDPDNLAVEGGGTHQSGQSAGIDYANAVCGGNRGAGARASCGTDAARKKTLASILWAMSLASNGASRPRRNHHCRQPSGTLAAAIAAHGPVQGPLGHPSAVTALDQTAADPTGLQSDPGLAAQQSAVAAQQSAVAPSTAC